MTALPSVSDLRALDVVDTIPSLCLGVPITNMDWWPHLRPGELAIFDTTDREPWAGELFVLIMVTAAGERLRIVQAMRGAGPGTMFRVGPSHIDGPLTADGWHEKCGGRVIAVMMAR